MFQTTPLPATLSTRDAIKLVLQAWEPATKPRGLIVLVHGLGEHHGRYAHVAAHLTKQGWRVVGFDQRGHGRSGGARGAVHAYDDYVFDTGAVIKAARASYPQGPLVLLGHSLGGLIAARYASAHLDTPAPDWYHPLDALVLSSPALDPGMSALQKLLLATLGRGLPNFAVSNGLKASWISRDPNVVRAYEQDPLVHGKVTGQVGRFILEEGRYVLAHAASWHLPTLLLYAGADRCVAPRGSAAFAAAAPSKVVRSHCYAPLFHEIFNEPEQATVLAEASAWLDGQFSR